MRSTVKNEYGLDLDYEAAVSFMDDDIRERLHREMAPCTDQEFFDAHCREHEKTFGEPFFLDDPNSVW